MALVSPGLEIDIIDDSQYVSTGVGTVPFVLIATAQDKTFQGSPAAYTSKANAGQLLAVTSQRDLITNLGYPVFEQSSAGTPLNGSETNEYGLMAAYSAMGVSNKMFLIRADIDLDEIKGSAIRPIGSVANGVYWLDTADSTWGIYEWNAVTQTFVNRVPMIITDSTFPLTSPPSDVGSVGSYAVQVDGQTVNGDSTIFDNKIYYKGADNIWTQIGSTAWQQEWPAVTGNVTATGGFYPTGTLAATGLTINGNTVIFSTDSIDNAVSQIASASIAGVTAGAVNNQLAIYATSDALNDGVTLSGNALPVLGITAGSYAAPAIQYGGYVSVPDWRETDTTPEPTGSVWFKTSSLGNGANFVLSEFNSDNDAWEPIATSIYSDDAAAIYAMDPTAGGNNITAGTVYVQQDPTYGNVGAYLALNRTTQGGLTVTGSNTAPTFDNLTDSITLEVTQIGSNAWLSATANISGNAVTDFISTVSSMSLPYVTASVTSTGAIAIAHTAGGSIKFSNATGTPVQKAGLDDATGVRTIVESGTTKYLASNFTPLTYTYSETTPYTAPVDGTLWFYNNPLDVDILVNETTGWKGYRTVSSDARGYNLVATDPNGPIMSPSQPTTQSDGVTAIKSGDLWIDTGDLANFPVISRYNATTATWTLIDNADQVDQNGIVFADARWDTDGTTDPVNGAYPAISAMLTSNYIDQDAPDHRLYPRGTLLFNMRRSGYNVKHYVSNYFNTQSFPDSPTVPGSLPLANVSVKATWVTSSGLKNDGSPYMGAGAQRSMVVKAMKAAIDGSETLREESFQFNLVVCPGYPELIENMVALNNDRKNTAFTIGDTPMNLPANAITITNWSTNANGDGLSIADPYYGVYYPSGLTTDLQGNPIVVPASHMVLRAAIKSDNVSYPWFAFAGTRRGLVDNCSDLGYVDTNSGEFIRNGLNQGMRDTLYPLAINPITLLPGVGLTVFGNKTRIGVASSLDRVNVARLVNYIRTILSTVGNGYLFEPNDKTTWDAISTIISGAMNDLVTKRGIYDYFVVCDSSNNTPQRIANNELYVDIGIEPEKDVEFIYIPIRLMNPGTIGGTQ